MTTQLNMILANSKNQSNLLNSSLQVEIGDSLRSDGYCLLRGFNTSLSEFSQLVRSLCLKVSYDPARESSEEAVQKVDAGTGPIGLHVENGNTPRVPQLVSFFCESAARHGSQTTLCDGVKLAQQLDPVMRNMLRQPVWVSRRLEEGHWKSYLANEHPALSDASQVKPEHLEEMLALIPGQKATLNADASLEYSVKVSPMLKDNLAGQEAFANAILGPSFNYEAPKYRFEDGLMISEKIKTELAEVAESITLEIDWQDGDIALIDNHRVLHGRRAITDESRRKLFIGMGDFS